MVQSGPSKISGGGNRPQSVSWSVRKSPKRDLVLAFSQVMILILSMSLLGVIHCPSVAAGIAWEPDQEISSDSGTERQNEPMIAVDGDKIHVVWLDNGDGDWDLYYRQYDGTNWLPEEIISTDIGTEEQYWPSVAASGGKVHVVWGDRGDGDVDIYYRMHNGTGWEPEIEISTDAGSEYQQLPNVAANGDEVHIVWIDAGDGDNDIYYRHFNGTDWQPEMEVSTDTGTETQYMPTVVAIGNKVHVAWTDRVDGDSDVYYRLFDGANWQTEEEISIDSGTENQARPRLVAVGDELFAAWSDIVPGDTDIYFRHFDGADWGPQQEIGTDKTGEAEWNVSIASDGFTIHVVWEDEEDGSRDIYHRLYNGTAWEPEEEISTDVGSARNMHPEIAFNGGIVHVVWTSERDGDWDIIYRRGESDTQPPVSQADHLAQYWSQDAALSIPWVATDNAGLVGVDLYCRHSPDNASWSGWTECASDSTISGTSSSGTFDFTAQNGEGYYEFYTIAKDGSGNTETAPITADMSSGLDMSPPTGSIRIDGGASVTTSTSVALTMTYSDDLSGVSGVRYRNDDTWDDEPWETPSGTKSWTLEGVDGVKQVCYQIKDRAGWTSPTYAGLISLDTTAPTVDDLLPADDLDKVEITSDITLRFAEEMNRTATESAFSMTLDGEEIEGTFTWSADGKNLTFDPIVDLEAGATYRVFVSASARDVAGNSLGDPIEVSFTTEKDKDSDMLDGTWTVLLVAVIVIVGAFAVLITTQLRKRGKEVIPEEEPGTEGEE